MGEIILPNDAGFEAKFVAEVIQFHFGNTPFASWLATWSSRGIRGNGAFHRGTHRSVFDIGGGHVHTIL